ncbi:MAG TPA: FtsW/RodA/SpoVE family cell cycle protein [Paludibacter sp.]|nr:FtsW/RodA/SpoVE family cell cycle protein [Paludibacter sp.]
MENLFNKYLKGDPILWIVFFVMCIISAIEMYSASSTLAYGADNYAGPMLRHVGFLFGGAIIAIVVHLIPVRYIRMTAYLVLLLSALLLVWVLFRGVSENGASRWLVIMGIKFQPSEFAKLSVIIVAADMISRIRDAKKDEWKYFRNTLIMLAIICTLILFDNFSTAFILFMVVVIMMFIGRVSLLKLGVLVGGLLLTIVLCFALVKTVPEKSMPKMFDRAYTWVGRIDRFKTEKKDEKSKYTITDENRQVQHGRIAIARGGAVGVFPGNSIERDYLPQAYSDFIYAIIVEEMGLFGGIFVILLYLVLLFRAGRIATKCATVFPALLVIGLSLMIVIQAFISMSVATSLGPVTGQPLPLISRGGTSILITCIYFGIIFGVNRQIKEEYQPPIEEDIPIEPEEELSVVDLENL